ncbi:MAG: hypothetical protein WA484_07265 [Solirubrobacteraceae bacterium]
MSIRPGMRSALFVAVVTFACLLMASQALAQNVDPAAEVSAQPVYGSAPPASSESETAGKVGNSPLSPTPPLPVPQRPSTGSGSTGNVTPPSGLPSASGIKTSIVPAAPKKLYTGTKCKKAHRKHICRTYRKGVLTKVCVRVGRGRNHCHKVRHKSAKSAAVVGNGYREPLPAVGKLFRDELGKIVVGHCTGTMITDRLLITAGHCLYSNSLTSSSDGFSGAMIEHEQLWFAADESFGGERTPASGQDVATASANAPYYFLKIVRSWVPSCWQSGDGGCDYGIAEVEPYSDGSYVGSYTGTYPLMWGWSVSDGQQFYLMGYPASQYFGTAAANYGDTPYYCDHRYDQAHLTTAENPGIAWLGTGYYIYAKGCPMTGGFSGGPVFTQGSNGTWYIGGVDNIYDNDGSSNGFASYNGFNYWTSVFGQFLCGVAPICT